MIPAALQALLSASRAINGLARESLGNPDWDAARARVLVLRLSPIRDVDRSSAHLILFSELRSGLPEAFIDFAFLPDRQDRELLERGDGQGLPWFFGAASGRRPSEFDLILVSNAFGLELVNLPRLFSTSGLPSRASARASAEGAPIVILGGSNAEQASAIVSEDGDSLVDGLFFGEGEGAVGPLASILLDGSRPRAERLLEAARLVEGFWPALHPELRVRRRILRDSPPPLLAWPPLDTPEAKTARLQITAGCPGYCSFCFEGWDRRPYRELPIEAVLEAAKEIRTRNGVETLEVYSFNFNTHAEIFRLLFELGRIFRNVSLMSQRLDVLARTPGLVHAELAAGKRSFTLGVEGISGRMRAYFRKGLSDEELRRLVELLVVPETREIKFFYILAGFETESDIEDFSRFLSSVAERRNTLAPGLRITASAGYLVRLPGTPLAHAPLILEPSVYSSMAAAIEKVCEETGVEWRLAVHFDEYCADQMVSLAGGRLLPWFESLSAAPRDAVYDGSLAKSIWPNLDRFARDHSIVNAAFLGEKDAGSAPRFPFFEEGTEGRVLHREYLAAKAFLDRTTCLGASCGDCGACPDPASRLFLTKHRTRPAEPDAAAKIARIVAAKRSFPRILVEVDRPESLAGASIEAQEAWLLATLCRLGRDSWKKAFSARLEAPLADGEFGVPAGATGWAVFALEGPSESALSELAIEAGLRPIAGTMPDRLAASVLIDDRILEAGRLLNLAEAREDRQGFARKLVVRWLAEARVAATEAREAELRRFDIAPRDIAKKSVLGARIAGSRIELSLGPRARLSGLCSAGGVRLSPLIAAGLRIARPHAGAEAPQSLS